MDKHTHTAANRGGDYPPSRPPPPHAIEELAEDDQALFHIKKAAERERESDKKPVEEFDELEEPMTFALLL